MTNNDGAASVRVWQAWEIAEQVQLFKAGPLCFVDYSKYAELEKRCKQLEAQLAHRHIIGKVYDVTAESINRLAGELEEMQHRCRELEQQLANPPEHVRGLVEAAKRYLTSRRVVEKELDWDAYEDFERALAAYDEATRKQAP